MINNSIDTVALLRQSISSKPAIVVKTTDTGELKKSTFMQILLAELKKCKD